MVAMKARRTTDVNESMGRATARLESWKEVPVGTMVRVMRDDGRVEIRRTRSCPWMLCGTPVIKLEGITGGFALCRCTVVEPKVTEAPITSGKVAT